MNASDIVTSSLVHISFIVSIFMTIIIYKNQQKSTVKLCFLALAFVLIIWNLGTMLDLDYRLITGESVDSPISIILIDLCYLAICFEPVIILFLGKAIYQPDWKPSLRHTALFIIPTISFLMVTTNPLHNLFFERFSLFSSEAVYGPYFYFHSAYSYALILIGLYYIVRVAIRNSGILSKQFFIVLIGIIVPLAGNILYSFGLADLPFSINAALFTVSMICFFVAIVRYKLFTVTSINMRQVIDLVSDAFLQVDKDMNIVDYNNTLLTLFPDVAHNIKHLNLIDFFEKSGFASQRNDFLNLYNQSVENKASTNMEISQLDSDNFTIHITPFFDQENYTGSIIIFKNIVRTKSTNEITLQNTLKEAEEYNRSLNQKIEEEKQARQSLFDSNPNINFIIDLDQNVIDCNPSAIKFYGFANKEELKEGLIVKLNQSLLAKQTGSVDKVSIKQRIAVALEKGESSFDTRLMFDGNAIPFHFDLKMIPYKGERVVAVYQTDLRELRQAEKDLEMRDNLLSTINTVAARLISAENDDLSKSFGDSIAMLGRSIDVERVAVWKNFEKDGELYTTQISDWVEGTESQFGFEHTIDLKYSESFPGWEELFLKGKCINAMVKDLPAGQRDKMQMQGIVSVLAVPLFVRDALWGFVGFDDCVSERKFSEVEETTLGAGAMLIAAALFRNEITGNLIVAREDALSSARAKSAFLANMSHEIRTPLNAIVGMANIAKRKTSNDDAIKPINEILKASKHLMELINDILDFSKIESGKMEFVNESFDVYEAMQDVASLIGPRCAEKDISFKPKLDGLPKISVMGDKLRLKQVLINLLGNAVKFTDKNGTIILLVDAIKQTDQDITLNFSVCDNGIGLKEEQKPNLFTAFEQGDSSVAVKYGGTGLGLAISQNIIKAFGGEIIVESTYNEGSTFKFTLTLQKSSEQKIAIDSVLIHEDFSLSGNRILLVEDIEINRTIIVELLSDTGIEIQEAVDGEQALQLFEQSDLHSYDLIFMDIQMPNMDGYQTTTAIRSLDREDAVNVPIIAMTANAFREDIDKAMDAGMDDHLAKPIDIDAVRNILYEYLTEKENSQQ